MSNQPIPERHFWQSRRFYIGAGIIALIIITALTFIDSKIAKDYAWGYANKAVFEKAFEASTNNEQVILTLGTLEPLGNMTIAEGQIAFTKNDGFTATVTIKGNKGKGKMDIKVHRTGNTWVYDYINIRNKEPQKTISIQVPEPIIIDKVAR